MGAPDSLDDPPPPFLAYCGIRRTLRENGVGRGEVDISHDVRNSAAAAHGGLLMTLLDSVMASAARSLLDGDHGVMTIDLQTQFLAPGRGTLFGEGKVVRGGKTLFFCEGTVVDGDGALIARGSGVFQARRPPRARG